jgi:hypothetical protein
MSLGPPCTRFGHRCTQDTLDTLPPFRALSRAFLVSPLDIWQWSLYRFTVPRTAIVTIYSM